MFGLCSKKSPHLNGSSALYLKVCNNQSVAILGSDGAHISCFCDDERLTVTGFDGVATLYDCFQRGIRLAGDKQCLGWRPSGHEPYKWITYNEVNARAIAFGSGLITLGLSQDNNVRVGIYSKNRPEYIIADQALFHHSLTSVALFDVMGEESRNFIINQSELSVITCDTNEKVKALLEHQKDLPYLKTLIIMETLSDENMSLSQKQQVKKLGRENPVSSKLPKQSDLCMVCYTSGSTGVPKGAMLTHGNMVATLSGTLQVLTASGFSVTSNDCLISYLPLAHSYERFIEASTFVMGAHIGFYQGDIKLLMDDIKELKPTIFPTVPRLLNKFFDKVMAGVNASKLKRLLFLRALNNKTRQLKSGIIDNDSIWDKAIFRKIQAVLGGNIRIITTGSAPISVTVLRFLRCVVGCPILEGYGQTECAAMCAHTMIGDFEPGHVGPPMPCNLIKLIDVPEMEYLATKDKGEICLKGPNVFLGYLKDEVKTKEVLDSNGWLHTGDIGEWLPNGTLKVIDRKKNIFKLAQSVMPFGEYIAPERIENVLLQSQWVSQIYVHGNSLQSCLVAIVVPEQEIVSNYASKHELNGSFIELLDNPELKKIIMLDLAEVGKIAGLSSLEMVKNIKLHPELFSVDNGLLTPTLKMKRFELLKVFAKDFHIMYNNLDFNHHS